MANPYGGISSRTIRPESPASPLAARGGQAARRSTEPPLRSEGTETASFGRELGVCPRTVPPPGNAVASGLHSGLAQLQPRRRDRLPEEVVSEGAHQRLPIALLRLRLRARATAGSPITARRRVPTREAGPTLARVVRKVSPSLVLRWWEKLTHS